MIEGQLTLRCRGAVKRAALATYLDASAEEAAHEASYRWIKSLRLLDIDGVPLRDRFTADRDSLWWFTELYLHKQQAVLDLHRAIAALTRALAQDAPDGLSIDGSPAVVHAAARLALARGIPCDTTVRPVTWLKRLAVIDARARRLHLSAIAAPERWRSRPERRPAAVAAFIHRAFWRAGGEEGTAESYVGPILHELEARLGADAVRYVGVGPATNFRRHRPLRTHRDPGAAVPIERFAPRTALASSVAVWRRRYADFRALTRAPAVREAGRIGDVDCWPIVREQLAGVAWLQWPWSARAIDEAGAALDALTPQVAVTYAEAGGWGRALVIAARRREIATIGLQHGFIYRHWLNYRHEPDEMSDTATPAFPLPTRTLLFDGYAARHLAERGRVPAHRLTVTGSPRLDALADELSHVAPDRVAGLRQALRIDPSAAIALFAGKEREARPWLAGFLDAAATVRGTVIVIKPHPAESAAAYADHTAGRASVRIAPEGSSLALLLAAARAVITVNSTVALDAGALGVPALSIGLPNNLSPFVEAGAIAGSLDPAALSDLLDRILYDEGFRQQLADRRRTVFADAGADAGAGEPRRAAARSAEAIVELIAGAPVRPA